MEVVFYSAVYESYISIPGYGERTADSYSGMGGVAEI